ncbi:MAG TPA: penicillin acylase family protein [Acidisarcina sp.]
MLNRESAKPWDSSSLPKRARTGRRRAHTTLKILIVVIAVLALLAFAIARGSLYWVHRAMLESLPTLDGEASLPGLSAAVTARRDAHGVPHIDAASLDDLLEAQGYITAQDRLWQMDITRRNAAGELAELFGRNLIDHDRTQRILQMRATADRLAASLGASDLRIYRSYARGVNAYIEQHRDKLPAEFRILRYKPAPWTPSDSILIALSMAQVLDQHFDDKLGRETITRRIGPALAADLYPTGSWRDHPPTAPVPDLTQPQPGIPDVPLDESQSSLRDLLELRRQLAPLAFDPETRCAECAPGSNEWVVSGAHTASGKPILSNDMHLSHGIPNIWYEVDLHVAGLDVTGLDVTGQDDPGLHAPGLHSAGLHVTGVSIPGMPLVVAGHNQHIAWGITALYGDTQDIYVEQINSDGQYLTPGGWRAIAHSHQSIKVRLGRDVPVGLATTAHGPVITPLLPGETRTLALKWTIYDPSIVAVPLLELDSAANWTEFRAALSHWWGPTSNIVYADDQGHIGYQAAGIFPLRPDGLAGVPIPVQDPATSAASQTSPKGEWNGFLPFDALPTSLDPPGGLLATANSRITPDGYPYPLTLGWASPYRNERIWKWLAGKDKLTPADMLVLQTDIYSALNQELGQRFAYAIDHSPAADPQLKEAADLLRNWDGVMSLDSSAASIVAAAKIAFWPLVLQPKLGDSWRAYQWPESSFAEEELIMHAPPAWLPLGYSTWDDLLTAALNKGLQDSAAPSELKSWAYGRSHQVEVSHPLYSMLPTLKSWTGTGPQPQSGDVSTVKQVSRSLGPSQRFTIDWGNPDSATENIVMGESGNPLSPFYRDQWPFWYAGKTFTLPFSEEAVAASTSHTLRLLP